MTHTRREFPESVKRAALERAGHRCQDPLCTCSDEWQALQAELGAVDVRVRARLDGLQFMDLIDLRDAIMAARFKHPRALNPIIKRFKLDGGALLEIDHEREDADGGEPVLENAIVRCVFCHAFKTQDRARARRAAPKIVKGSHRVLQPEQLTVHDGIRMNTVSGLQAAIQAKEAAGSVAQSRSTSSMGQTTMSSTRPRRHPTDADVQAAVQRREQQTQDGWFWGA